MGLRHTRSIFFITLLLLWSVGCYSNPKQNTQLENLISEALLNNPQIQAARSRWKAAEYKVSAKGSLPDPEARYTYFGKSVQTRVGPQKNKYGGSIKIPFPVKLTLEAKAQAKRAEVLKEKYEAVKREIIEKVKSSYYDLYWIDQAIDITEQEKAVVDQIEKVAQKKYESNEAVQQDVIRAQIEISSFLDRILRLKQSRKAIVAKINRILSRAQGTEIISNKTIGSLRFLYELMDLRKMALECRQELLAAKLDVEKAKFEKSLATWNYMPDVTLGFDYIQVGKGHTNMPNDGQDAWMGTVSINVPIWFNKLSAEVKEKKALLQATQKSVTSVKDKILYEIEDIYYKILAYKDIVSLYKTALVPQAKQSIKVAERGYEAGEVEFIDWLDAERVLLHIQLAYYKAIVDYLKSIAFLERVIGKDLE